MSAEARQEASPVTGNEGAGCLAQLGWLASGFVLPLASFSFFRRATRGRVATAIVFFFLFTVTIALVSTLGLARSIFSAGRDIRTTFDNGTFPEIVIRDGIAQVQGRQPMFLVDQTDESGQRMIVAIDTTGRVNEIDRSRYDEGFLLTRTELHMVSQDGQYQVVPLSELQTAFGANPIIINADTATRGWNVFAAIFTLLAFIVLVLWDAFVRLMFVAMIALLLWGLASLIRPNTGFEPIIISGMYALVPAIYLHYVIRQAGFTFPGLQTFLLLAIWVIALIASLSEAEFFKREEPPRLWRAWLGIPMLIALAASVIFDFRYESIIVAGLVLLTAAALAGIGIHLRQGPARDAALPPPAAAG